MSKLSALATSLRKLSHSIDHQSPINLHHLEKACGDDCICFMILVLCLPFYFPISIPGISTPFGLAITWIAFKEFLSHQPHLPHWLAKITLSHHSLQKMIHVIEFFDQKTGRWIHLRWPFISKNRFLNRITDLVAIICGLILCLPIPIPFSNWIPAITLLLTFMGRLYSDGLWLVAGISLCSIIVIAGFWMAGMAQEVILQALNLTIL